jgi:hypothetical protein
MAKRAATKPDPQHTSDTLKALLRERYPLPVWTLITEAPDGTSSSKSRSADAMAMGCWKTAGIEMHGFEIKISRWDWQRELNDLSKAEVFARHCHRWFLVAPPGIIHLDELPAEWGLMEPVGKGSLRIRKAATRNRNPQPLGWEFLAALLRRAATEYAAGVQTDPDPDAGPAPAGDFRQGSRYLQIWKRRAMVAEKALREQGQHAGLQVQGWNAEQISQVQALAMQLLTSTRQANLQRIIKHFRDSLASALDLQNLLKLEPGK